MPQEAENKIIRELPNRKLQKKRTLNKTGNLGVQKFTYCSFRK